MNSSTIAGFGTGRLTSFRPLRGSSGFHHPRCIRLRLPCRARPVKSSRGQSPARATRRRSSLVSGGAETGGASAGRCHPRARFTRAIKALTRPYRSAVPSVSAAWQAWHRVTRLSTRKLALKPVRPAQRANSDARVTWATSRLWTERQIRHRQSSRERMIGRQVPERARLSALYVAFTPALYSRPEENDCPEVKTSSGGGPNLPHSPVKPIAKHGGPRGSRPNVRPRTRGPNGDLMPHFRRPPARTGAVVSDLPRSRGGARPLP